jgi:hypothetical protein
MTPPQAYADFIAGGATNQDQVRTYLKTANFIGNEVIWLILPDRGEMIGRLVDKFLPWILKPGNLQWEARRLDGRASVAKRPAGPTGHDPVGFQGGVVELPAPGCWEITYTLDNQYPLRFVVRATQ